MDKSPGYKRDRAVVAALIVLGAILLGACSSLWRMVERNVLASAAEATARDWSEHMASRPLELSALLAKRRGPAEAAPESIGFGRTVKGFRLADVAGEIVASGGETNAGRGAIPRDKQTLAWSGQASIDVGAWDGGAPGTVAVVPILGRGGIVAAAELLIDQSEDASRLSGALNIVAAAAAGVAALGFAVPSLLLCLRLRERRRAEDRVRFLAVHDALTGLPNRGQFTDRLVQLLDRGAADGRRGCVVLVNIDRFRAINETYGHEAGDSLLRELAARLQGLAGPGDAVARLAVDEFALLSEAIVEAPAAHLFAERLAAALRRPFALQERSVSVTVSMGVVLFPRDGQEAEPLLRHASLAIEQAKAEGGDTIRFFEGELAEAARRRRRLEHDLRLAVATDGLEVHYQPQFDLVTGALTGCEALARWRHPSLGFIPPNQFIPIAEETGLIAQLGEWVLRTACSEAKRWPAPVKVAVNLSAAQFKKGAIAPAVQRILAETGLPASRLELEITESLLLGDTETTLAELRRLRDIGVSVAMDDFGTGYSSLSSLSRFPFSKIKIDKSFIQRLTADKNVAAIVNAIVSLGRALQVTITAEGVETRDQAALLRRAGCSEVQGYLYGRPMPAGDFAARLMQTKATGTAAQVA